MRRHASRPGPRRPARAHIVRIGTLKVLSFPYRAMMARARVSGSSEPAFLVSQISAASLFGKAADQQSRRRADVAVRQRGIAPPAVGVLMVDQEPLMARTNQRIDLRTTFRLVIFLQRECSGRSRKRAAGEFPFPVTCGIPCCEQPALCLLVGGFDFIVEKRHRLRCPNASRP